MYVRIENAHEEEADRFGFHHAPEQGFGTYLLLPLCHRNGILGIPLNRTLLSRNLLTPSMLAECGAPHTPIMYDCGTDFLKKGAGPTFRAQRLGRVRPRGLVVFLSLGVEKAGGWLWVGDRLRGFRARASWPSVLLFLGAPMPRPLQSATRPRPGGPCGELRAAVSWDRRGRSGSFQKMGSPALRWIQSAGFSLDMIMWIHGCFAWGSYFGVLI